MRETHVVTCFLRSGSDVLLLLRSSKVGSYAGKWGAVAGHAEGDPDSAAVREIREETGIDNADLVRRGTPFEVHDEALGKRWIVHPYLFEVGHRDVKLNWESERSEWVAPTAILRRDVVPDLWKSYRYVAPTLDLVRKDEVHGSAYLSLRAVEVLRDRAAEIRSGGNDGWTELSELALSLLEARRSMASVRNRVNRVMHAAKSQRSAESVEAAANDLLRTAAENDAEAARIAADLIDGKRVLTLSRSGTVVDALLLSRADVIVAQSLPGGEGCSVAEQLAGDGLLVTLCMDAGIAVAAEQADVLLVGADTILPDGTVVNKVGTTPAALVAEARGIPVHVAAAVDKIATDRSVDIEPARREALYDGAADIRLINPLFEATPPELITSIITERGAIKPSEVAQFADELRDLESWR